MGSLLNGFSQMGKSIQQFAGAAGLAQQKADLEKEQTEFANTLREGSETRLAAVQGDQQRQTTTLSATLQGDQARQTAQFANDLPLTEAQREENKIKQQDADTRRMDVNKPIAGGFTGTFLIRDPKEPTGYKVVNGSSTAPITIDKTSNNLSAQTGLSNTAIALMTGQTKGMKLNAAQTKAAQDEVTAWGVANGINTSTMLPQVEASFNVLKNNIQRNNQANILENELISSIDTASPILDDMNAGRVKFANVLDVWAGKEVNDPNTIKAADQLSRLRQELAGYNAVAGGHLMENGTPAPTPENFHEAERTISNGINSGGLNALRESVNLSASKNRAILENAIDQANKDYYKLFGATYRPPAREAGHNVTPPPAPEVKAPNTSSPTLPPGVPSGSQYSPKRKQWRDPTGKLYDETGKEV